MIQTQHEVSTSPTPHGRRWRVFGLLLAVLLLGASAGLAGEPPKGKFLLTWGEQGDKPGEFYSPIGLAVNRHDEVFVTDLNNSRIQKFSSDGEYLGGFDLPRDNPKRKSCLIGGIVVDELGLLHLAFMNQHKIGVYTEAGKLVREWGKPGNGPGEFRQPGGLVLSDDGILYVADQCNHRVQAFKPDGTFLSQWGKHGVEPGEFGGDGPAGSRFGGPHFLSQDRQGRLYTTEGTMGRIQQLSVEGKPLAAWGDKGDQPGGFGSLRTGFSKTSFGPVGVYVVRHDRVWVSSLNDRVQVFTPEGKFLWCLGESGDEPGQFARPHGMVLDRKGHLYVADAGNQRIQKFAIPEP